MIGLLENKTADSSQTKIHALVPRPFPRKAMGSGHETRELGHN